MVDNTNTSTDTSWTERQYRGVPYGDPVTIPLNVSGNDHPGAVLIALHAPRALAAYQHVSELADLSKDDLYELLSDVRKLAAAAAVIEETLILRHREAGASWAELGAALDTGRSAAKERYTRIQYANSRGLNTRGLADQDAEYRAVIEAEGESL